MLPKDWKPSDHEKLVREKRVLALNLNREMTSSWSRQLVAIEAAHAVQREREAQEFSILHSH